MNINSQIARVKELIAQREEIDRQLADLFGGVPSPKRAVRCTVCGEMGHNAKTCARPPGSERKIQPEQRDTLVAE